MVFFSALTDLVRNVPAENLSQDCLMKSRKDLLIFSFDISFLVQNTSSIRDTLGVGTLIAIPSSLPFNEGIISPIAFDAPVEVGTID